MEFIINAIFGILGIGLGCCATYLAMHDTFHDLEVANQHLRNELGKRPATHRDGKGRYIR